MVWMILRLFLPYMGRYAAGKTADFLQKRREQRLARESGRTEYFESVTGVSIDRPECPPCPPCPAVSTDPAENSRPAVANRVWLSLSGLLLGGLVGVIGYLLLNDSRTPT
jgi:hypothetical protein